jgi:hypothetical protein
MHKHRCTSKFHRGKRVRACYSETCTDHYDSACWPCHDQELEADGAVYETGPSGGPSDADPGL